LTARWIYLSRWNAWRVVIKGYNADDVRSNVALQELAHFDSLFPALTKTPKRRHKKKTESAGARSTSSIDCAANAGDYYDYGDYSSAGDCGDYGDSGDFGDSGTPGGDTGGDTGGGGGGDAVETKRFCPPFCPSQLWYSQQHGSVQMGSNQTLPDGSTWTSTDVDHSKGVVHGYIYYGSNGSQWYTGYNDASHPETMDQFQRNMDALYAQYQKDNNCV
jgi:hypothetical protein